MEDREKSPSPFKKDTSFTAYSEKPLEDWTIDEVVDYARKVLNFSEKSAKILIHEEVTGHTLLAIQNYNGLESYGLPRGATDSLWAEIEKSAQELNGRRLLRVRNEDAFISAGLSLGAASDLWAEIEKMKKSLAEKDDFPREKPQQDKKRKRSDSDEETQKKKRQKINRRYSAPSGNPTVSQYTAWVGREADMERMAGVLTKNQRSLAFRPTTIAIGGPCGIGKTRLALQFIEKSQFNFKVLVDVPPRCKDINELFKPYLGFNGDSLSVNLRSFVVEKLEQREDPNTRLKLVIYLDEIQNLDFDQLVTLRHAIRLCADLKEHIVIQLIISGTHLAFLRASFDETDWTTLQTSTGGIAFINLQPLRLTDSSTLLKDVIKEVHKKSNAQEISKMPFVEETLKWLGGNPRLIEFLADKLACADLNNCDAKQLLKAVKKDYWDLYSERQGNSEHYYKVITSACLARVKLTLGSTLSDGINATTIRQLIFQGSAVWTQNDDGLGTKDTEGYLSLPLAVIRWYITKKNIKNAFSLKLFVPDFNWRWEEFEHFTAELVALRLRAYWMCGYKSVSLKSLFEDLPMSPDIEQHEVPLGPFTVCRLSVACKLESDVTSTLTEERVHPLEQNIKNAEDPEDKEIANLLLQKAKSEMNFLVVRNAPLAPSWDAAVYVNNSIVLAIQTKYTQRIEDPLAVNVSKAEIIVERDKVPATIPLLFITNRPIQAKAKALTNTRKRLILVHKENFSVMLGAFGNLWRFT